jgi:hypothetical protein
LQIAENSAGVLKAGFLGFSVLRLPAWKKLRRLPGNKSKPQIKKATQKTKNKFSPKKIKLLGSEGSFCTAIWTRRFGLWEKS